MARAFLNTWYGDKLAAEAWMLEDGAAAVLAMQDALAAAPPRAALGAVSP
jgi:hypothetical protein